MNLYAPGYLASLCKLGIGNKNYCDQLAKAFSSIFLSEVKGFIIEQYPEEVFIQLIELANTQEGGSICKLINHFTERQLKRDMYTLSNHGVVHASECISGLHQFARFAPNALIRFISLCKNENGRGIRQALGNAPSLKETDGRTGLYLIVDNIPSLVPTLIKLSEQDKEFREKFYIAIQQSTAFTLTHDINEYVIRNNISKQSSPNYAGFFKLTLIRGAVGGLICSVVSLLR